MHSVKVRSVQSAWRGKHARTHGLEKINKIKSYKNFILTSLRVKKAYVPKSGHSCLEGILPGVVRWSPAGRRRRSVCAERAHRSLSWKYCVPIYKRSHVLGGNRIDFEWVAGLRWHLAKSSSDIRSLWRAPLLYARKHHESELGANSHLQNETIRRRQSNS